MSELDPIEENGITEAPYFWPKYIDSALNSTDLDRTKLEVPLTLDDMGPFTNTSDLKAKIFDIDFFQINYTIYSTV